MHIFMGMASKNKTYCCDIDIHQIHQKIAALQLRTPVQYEMFWGSQVQLTLTVTLRKKIDILVGV